MPQIKLNFVNASQDSSNVQLVIFQPNEAVANGAVVAWTVIENCTPGKQHAFNFSTDLFVGASDSFRNHLSHLPASDGDAFKVISTLEGNQLHPDTSANQPEFIQVLNDLPLG